MLVIKNQTVRQWIARISTLGLCTSAVIFLFQFPLNETSHFSLDSEWINYGIMGIEILVTLFLIIVSIRDKKVFAGILALLNTGIVLVYELVFASALHNEFDFYVDKFTVIMVLIVGIIGSLVCQYAVGYMHARRHHNPDEKDNTHLFLFQLYAFLSAMFGIIFSDSLTWIFFFWEMTTLFSFLLIGYSQDKVSVKNSYLALILNLIGGLGFAAAIFYLGYFHQITGLAQLLKSDKLVVMLPVALLCLAGLAKSAQFPFSPWLLGAMVAPSPVSALLHSSTMVKAGVYLILRLSPLLSGTLSGDFIALVGGVTFLIASLIATTQTISKRILAYSTIANLGLIIACAGIGSYATVWAAIFLVIFHAVSKSLLFMSMGSIGHAMHSLDVEKQDNLIVRMPLFATMAVVGICGMFIAPFGMLISKWAALEAFINSPNIVAPIVILLIAYGSAVTIFYWAKWLGKILSYNGTAPDQIIDEQEISRDERLSNIVLTILTIVACLVFPFISRWFVEPYTQSVFTDVVKLDASNFVIMVVMVSAIMVIPAVGLIFHKKYFSTLGSIYMSGRTVSPENEYPGAMNTVRKLELRNHYLGGIINESVMQKIGIVVSILLIAVSIGVAFL
jgi:ech hydrogenase subunit A